MKEKLYQNFLEKNPYPRELKNYDLVSGSDMYLMYQGQRLINFSSSNYLGLARHPFLIAQSQAFAEQYGVGSTASRLVTANLRVYETLEQKIAQVIGKPAALILGTGYQANTSILEALLDNQVLGEQPLVFADKYCHVSMLATTQHYARLHRFRHLDLNHLESLLDKYQDSQQSKFILVESIFSMDGDQTDFARLIPLAKKYKAYLYVDDAHAVGIYGKNGWGLAADHAQEIDFILGTFSKGLGGYGAYFACSDLMREYLINKCRGLIYSTALAPSVLGTMSGSIEMLPQLVESRQRLVHMGEDLRLFFQQLGLDYGQSSTHIIPWIMGDAAKTLKASELLKSAGILAATIRPPSVPVNKSRIRFCLSAGHTDSDILALKTAIKQVSSSL